MYTTKLPKAELEKAVDTLITNISNEVNNLISISRICTPRLPSEADTCRLMAGYLAEHLAHFARTTEGAK